jgi:FkbM family methyltransferase
VNPVHPSLERLVALVDRHLDREAIHTIVEAGARDCAETIAFRTFFPDARIFAFECNPQTLPLCRTAAAGLTGVELVERAVSDVDGKVSFFAIDPERTETTWPDGNPGASSLLRASGKYPLERYVQREIGVESTRLDTFLDLRNVATVDLLWLDIQGAELMALRGAGERLRDVKLVHAEVEFLEIYSGQPLFGEVRRYLRDHGFLFVGFTAYGEFSADAVFVNSAVASPALRRRARLEALPGRHWWRSRAERWFRPLLRARREYVRNRRRLDLAPVLALQRTLALAWLRSKRPLALDPALGGESEEGVSVDLFIPLVERDLAVFRVAFESYRRFLRHPVRETIVVSPESRAIREFCRVHGCRWLDEREVAPVARERLEYAPGGLDRTGWLLKQLIILNADQLTTSRHILVLDGDTILVRPQVFSVDEKPIFNRSWEYHKPYFQVVRQLIGGPIRPLSFVSHGMLFREDVLAALRARIEERSGLRWYDAILASIDWSQVSAFSEYELYGNFFVRHAAAAHAYWYNHSRRRSELADLDRLVQTYGSTYKSLSFHWWVEAARPS